MKWPEFCDCCYPRRREKPAIMNPHTGRAYCRKCEDMPGFLKTIWDSKSPPIRRGVPVDDPQAEEPKIVKSN